MRSKCSKPSVGYTVKRVQERGVGILMKKLKMKTGDWIVVCDGRKALILENVGDHAFPILHTKEVREHPDLSTSSQGSDEPGRVHQSMGHARSAIDQTDWHDQAERAFLTALASRLHAGLTEGETRALAVIAPPRALGMIREAYSPSCVAPSKSNLPRIS